MEKKERKFNFPQRAYSVYLSYYFDDVFFLQENNKIQSSIGEF